MQTYDNYISGEWISGVSATSNRNPSNLADVIGEYAQADAEQAKGAIAAAANAFPAWAIGSIQERANSLDRIGAEILARKDELGRLLSREEGKTLPEGVGEVTRAGQIFRFFAGEVVRASGEKLPSIRPGVGMAAKAIARMAKLQLEMGGKNPLVVLDDADLSTAVNVAVQGAYYSTGQRCTASSRLIVTTGIHDRFVAALADKVKALEVDDALAPGTDLGPVVDQSQLDQDLSYLDIGRKEGATLVLGGERLKRQHDGYYLAPALFTEASNDMRISREEIFGPVASVIRARDYEEALALANDTEFGLSTGIVTTSLKHASHFKRHAQAGMVMVNLPTAGVDYHVPFGGRKGSRYGPRVPGSYAREFYTSVKTAYTAAG